MHPSSPVASPQTDEARDAAIKFEDRFERFTSSRMMRCSRAMLYLLYCLRDSGSHPDSTAVSGFSLKAVGDSDQHDESESPAADSLAVTSTQSESSISRSAAMLHEYVRNTTRSNTLYEIPEEALVRDVLYCLQGIDGRFVKYDRTADGYGVVPEVGVPKPVRNLVRRICELGWMFRGVSDYVHRVGTTNAGLVAQSFCGALQKELTEYYRMIAILESQVIQSMSGASAGSSSNRRSDRKTNTKAGDTQLAASPTLFTLRRMYVWVQDPLQRLRLMAMLCEAADNLKGGALGSAIGAYLSHGNPFIKTFARKIMRQICRPIFVMIYKWVSAGELQDPYDEFFIASDAKVLADRLWQDKYALRKDMIPSFISLELANKILLIGKSINFIRECCDETEWVSENELKLTFSNELVQGAGQDIEDLERSVNQAGEIVNKRLLRTMKDKFHVHGHCLALKKYLLMSQGDFIQKLLDLISPELDKPASELSRHHIQGILHSAVRASNAQYEDPEFIGRLNVNWLKEASHDTGWTVFSLDYHTSTPINVLFTDSSIKQYLTVFNFLWKLKRVEHALSSTWSVHMAGAFRLPALSSLQHTLRLGYQLRSEMMHFVHNLHNYMMFEVMECAWKDLEEDMKKASDLDQLIAAHDRYLSQITEKALMGRSIVDNRILKHLHSMISNIIAFCSLQGKLYRKAFKELDRQNVERKQMYMTKTQWGVSGAKEKQMDQRRQVIPKEIAEVYGSEIRNMTATYHKQLFQLLDDLGQHASQDLRFLRVRLDFNEHYANKK
jgi:gamma-tubulin complex component 3